MIVLELGTLKDGPNATGLGISKMANMRLCYAYFHQVKSVLFHFSHWRSNYLMRETWNILEKK